MTAAMPSELRHSAEWICTKCGVVNRKLVKPGATVIEDRCVSCGTRHQVRPGPRPPFWLATARR
jgi:hypothetical protein